MVVNMSAKAHFWYFLLSTAKSVTVWVKYLTVFEFYSFCFIFSFFNVDNYRTNIVYNNNSNKMLIVVNALNLM